MLVVIGSVLGEPVLSHQRERPYPRLLEIQVAFGSFSGHQPNRSVKTEQRFSLPTGNHHKYPRDKAKAHSHNLLFEAPKTHLLHTMKNTFATPKTVVRSNHSMPKLRKKRSAEFIGFVSSEDDACLIPTFLGVNKLCSQSQVNHSFLKKRSAGIPSTLRSTTVPTIPELSEDLPRVEQAQNPFKLHMRPRMTSVVEMGALYMPHVVDDQNLPLVNIENLSIPDLF